MIYWSRLSACVQMKSAQQLGLGHLQEEPLVLEAVDLLGRLDQLLGGVDCLTAGQQLVVQSLQLGLLLLLQPGRPLVVSLGQRLQHVVVVLLQVLLLPAEILLHTVKHRIYKHWTVCMSVYTVCTSWTSVHKCMHTEPSAVNPLYSIVSYLFEYISILFHFNSLSEHSSPPFIYCLCTGCSMCCLSYLINRPN